MHRIIQIITNNIGGIIGGEGATFRGLQRMDFFFLQGQGGHRRRLGQSLFHFRGNRAVVNLNIGLDGVHVLFAFVMIPFSIRRIDGFEDVGGLINVNFLIYLLPIQQQFLVLPHNLWIVIRIMHCWMRTTQ